jgi:hypothetical protein
MTDPARTITVQDLTPLTELAVLMVDPKLRSTVMEIVTENNPDAACRKLLNACGGFLDTPLMGELARPYIACAFLAGAYAAERIMNGQDQPNTFKEFLRENLTEAAKLNIPDPEKVIQFARRK